MLEWINLLLNGDDMSTKGYLEEFIISIFISVIFVGGTVLILDCFTAFLRGFIR